jgi:hypothetical protein
LFRVKKNIHLLAFSFSRDAPRLRGCKFPLELALEFHIPIYNYWAFHELFIPIVQQGISIDSPPFSRSLLFALAISAECQLF